MSVVEYSSCFVAAPSGGEVPPRIILRLTRKRAAPISSATTNDKATATVPSPTSAIPPPPAKKAKPSSPPQVPVVPKPTPHVSEKDLIPKAEYKKEKKTKAPLFGQALKMAKYKMARKFFL